MRKGLVLICGIVVLAGCGNEPGPTDTPPASTQATSQALFDRWKILVSQPNTDRNSSEYLSIAMEILNRAPELADKMIDTLVDPATPVENRDLILNSLEMTQTDIVIPRLIKLTEPDVDPGLRAGVTIVLSRSANAAAQERLRQLAQDTERRVRLAAMCGLAEQGDIAMRNQLREYYFTDIPPQHRMRIINTLSAMPEPEDMKVFQAAANDSEFPEQVRIMAIGPLGRLGDPASIPALEQCVASDAPEEVKKIAAGAIAVIQSKQGQASPPQAPDATNQPGGIPAGEPAAAAPEAAVSESVQ